MAITERLALIIDADGKGAVRELEKVGSTAEREIGKAESSLDKVGKKMTSVGATMMAGAAVVGVALWDASQATSDLAEAADYSGRVFGEASGQIAEFAEGAEAIGLSERAAHEAATTFADLLKATGATKDELADMSVEMTELAADMASAKNTTPEEAIEALGAALRGESEPIRRYGVMLDEATLKQKALDMGLVETTKGTLPMSIKMQAAYASILDQTAGMQGNFADTADSAANKQRVMAAQIENAKATIGEGFLPVMSSMIGMVSAAADKFGEMNEQTGGSIGQFAAVGTVLLGVGGTLSYVAGQAIAMSTALKASAAAGSAAAATTIAAMGPAAVAVAALTAAYLTFQAKVNQSDGAMDAMLSEIDTATSGVESAEALYRKQAALVEEHNSLVEESSKGIDFWNNAEAQAYADATHETGKRVEATQSMILVMEGLAGATGESKDSALAWLQAQAETGTVFENTEQALQVYNAQMDATGAVTEDATIAQSELNKKYEDAIGDLDKLIDKIDEYFGKIQSGTDRESAWHASIDSLTSTVADNGMAWNWMADQLDITTEAGRENWEAMQKSAEIAVDMGQAVLQAGGSTEDAAKASLDYAANLRGQLYMLGYNKEMVDQLFGSLGLMPDQINTAFNQPGITEAQHQAAVYQSILAGIPREIMTSVGLAAIGGGSFIGNAVAARASGGPVSAGMPYLVGEQGPELVVPGQSGTVLPAGQTAALMGGGGGSTTVNLVVDGKTLATVVSPHLQSDRRSRTGSRKVA